MMQSHELTAEVYRLIQRLPRVNASTPRHELPVNGIYLVFEDGEEIELDGKMIQRVVRVGTHTRSGRCGKRIRQHYGRVHSLGGNKNTSVFRKHVGSALLLHQDANDSRLGDWLRPMGPGDADLEMLVSQYLREHITFAWFPVDDPVERITVEGGLIALFAQHPLGQPSAHWLGHDAVHPDIRRTGLWNTRDVNATPLTLSQFQRMVKFTCRIVPGIPSFAPDGVTPSLHPAQPIHIRRTRTPITGIDRGNHMVEFVDAYSDVVENVRQFNQDLHANTEIVGQLSLFKHWYYIPDLNAFAPSKYIGYKGMTTGRYQRGKDKDGRDTEVVLRPWFVELDEFDPRWTNLAAQLEQVLQRYGKEPRSGFRIHVPR